VERYDVERYHVERCDEMEGGVVMSEPDTPEQGRRELRPQSVSADDLVRRVRAFGADENRWPEDMRVAAREPLTAASGAVGDAIKEEAQLARILDHAPAFDGSRLGALTDRITSAAAATPRLVNHADAAIAKLAGSSPDENALLLARSTWSRSTWSGSKWSRSKWSSAAVLAASLVMGILVGQTDISSTTLPSLVKMAGLSIDSAAHQLGHPEGWDED
jgi:hypothetical protein